MFVSSNAEFPSTERYGLSQQLRRSAVSISSNIVEGAARPTSRDFARFIGIALASASESEYQLLLACDLGYINTDEHRSLSQRAVAIRRMLIRLREQVAEPS